jgi:starch synthase (maltosyl-transferring)
VYRPRDWSEPEKTLAPYLTMLNRVRREHPSMQWIRNLTFHDVDSPDVLPGASAACTTSCWWS